MIPTARAWPRAGLGGNPSDVYGGRTVAFTFNAFEARVRLEPAPSIMAADLEAHDLSAACAAWPAARYGSAAPLIPATITTFARELERLGARPPARGFALRWDTTIPRGVGMGGSSAIAVAALRCLAEWAGVRLRPLRIAQLALEVETMALGIVAGPMDRVVQALEGLVFMDFHGSGARVGSQADHAVLPGTLVQHAFVAWHPALGEDSGVYHSDLRARYEARDRDVLAAVRRWADIALEMRDALETGEQERFCDLIDENFDLRRTVSRVRESDAAMVNAARRAGAAAKQAGSGGAVVGALRGAEAAAAVERALRDAGARFRWVRPAGGKPRDRPGQETGDA